MSYSEIEIANIALNSIGKAAIRDFSTEDTDPVTGRLSKRLYAISRDSLISGHDWSFARSTKYINKKTEEHPEGILYALPSDCFVPRRLLPRLGRPNKWTIEGRNLVIPTSLVASFGSRPILRYTQYVTNTGLFPPYFVTALAMSLAASICMPLTADLELTHTVRKDAVNSLAYAKLVDSNIGSGDDGQEQDIEYDTFIDPDVGGNVFYG